MIANKPKLPTCLPGFEAINRYWDSVHNTFSAKILPGQYYVTAQNEIITTVLGSCISVCVYDPRLKVGGMNHFMLPNSDNDDSNVLSKSFRYGDVAMERLVNDLLRNGSDKSNLVFKAFGGGQIIRRLTAIGQRNISFLHKFLMLEGYKLTASDLGGPHPRKLIFFPQSGLVRVKQLKQMYNETILVRESNYETALNQQEDLAGEIDLFDDL